MMLHTWLTIHTTHDAEYPETDPLARGLHAPTVIWRYASFAVINKTNAMQDMQGQPSSSKSVRSFAWRTYSSQMLSCCSLVPVAATSPFYQPASSASSKQVGRLPGLEELALRDTATAAAVAPGAMP